MTAETVDPTSRTDHRHPSAQAGVRTRGSAARARDRADRSVSGLAGLLARRPELRGVHAPADAFDEAVRWSC